MPLGQQGEYDIANPSHPTFAHFTKATQQRRTQKTQAPYTIHQDDNGCS
jgi:hypothetical protein